MPFMASGGGQGVPAPPAAVTMQVEPDRVLALKARYEAVRDSVQDFLDARGSALRAVPLAADEVSGDAAEVFSDNATTAIEVSRRFVDELNLNIEQLHQAAVGYRLVEDGGETAIRQIGKSTGDA
ncbi:PE family protein [Saccharothrix syringae]|uniref:PE family protein n=2 Tax=Saccharothrix syringae TaxID=103733 RepID=A0A5Q0GUC8_SACSY|nr:PE family protein [Saccharothrix syringae]QFZ17598.1 PE family protein [Saccharothrix syringae]